MKRVLEKIAEYKNLDLRSLIFYAEIYDKNDNLIKVCGGTESS